MWGMITLCVLCFVGGAVSCAVAGWVIARHYGNKLSKAMEEAADFMDVER